MLMGYTAMAQKPRALKVVFEYDARPNQADTVFHDINTQITTADFTGRPSRSGPSEAVSFTSFSYEGGSRQTPDSLIVTLYLQVFMVKGSSRIRGSLSLSHTPEHEQLHFDITRLVGERFRQKVLSMPLTIDDYDGRIQYEYRNLSAK
ncbi:hypothetical protein MKQ70_28030 [Chitinophaga sedimenti]|uniref:hypothetical protein n=1 Tax=Chitinophaga sedimenti TaxID=2033606 RepID=UPI002002F9E4|nr:hypothetical protein [Chitinophaga sedimenti]MCK7558637.1 hypothetical protein [Chitinophaga sedimenti]